MRLSSPAMTDALVRGASDAGADVARLGLVGTEMVYFAVGELGFDGGIAVTASHNPKEYTGMKIVRRGALPVGGDSGLLDIRARAMSGARHETGAAGTVSDVDIWPQFVERVLSFVDVDAVKPLRVVIDAANGMAGAMLPPVLDRLPIDAVRCYFDPDGSFPNHEPNPLLPENREFIIGKVKEEHADVGVAFDGDADRCFFVDDTGEFVPGDFVTALLAESILEKEPGAKILYDVRASWAVPETIRRAGGEPLVNRVGHAFFKHRMREEGAVFGGEVSGHYYFRDFSQADSGVTPFLLMLELVSKRGRKLSEILRDYRNRYFITGELNTPVADVALKLQELKERFGSEGRVSHLDGLSVDAEDWHMNVRPSNTEPLLRLNLEALSPDLMERKRDEVLEVIRAEGKAAVQVLRADARGLLGHRRAGDRLLRPVSPLLRRRAGRIPPQPRAARDGHRGSGPGVRDARMHDRLPRTGGVRRPDRGLRPHGQDRADERDIRARGVQSARRRAHGHSDADARARRPRRAQGRADPGQLQRSDPRLRRRRAGVVSEAVEAIVARDGDADDILRDAVAALGETYEWVGIAFVEENELVLGPATDAPPAETFGVPISYDGAQVAELRVAPAAVTPEQRASLERAAVLLSPYCLVGWDTGGEAWSP